MAVSLLRCAAIWCVICTGNHLLAAQAVQFSEIDIVGSQSILNGGTFVRANNFGDGNPQNASVNGASPVIVNGVAFGTNPSALVSGTGNWVFAGGPLNDYSLVYNTSDPALDTLLSGSANLPADRTATLRLTDLQIGTTYRLQIPATHDRFWPDVQAVRRWFVNLDGGSEYDFFMNGGGDGRLPENLIIRFTADSTTTNVNVRGGTMPNGPASDIHIMGYALHAVPEPTGVVLVCIGLATLQLRRPNRRRRSRGVKTQELTTRGRPAAVRTTLFTGISTLLVTTVVASAQAASIPVFTFYKLNSEADILNAGTILRATNLGNTSEGTFNSVTVNGINFGTSTSGMTGWSQGGGDFSTEFPTGSPLDKLLSGTWFAPGGSSSLNLTGLTSGKNYIYQMFLANSLNTTGHESRVTIQGQAFSLTGKYNGLAHVLQIDFAAGGASELITFGTGDTYGPERMQFNGFTLQTAVPEPCGFVLFSMALLSQIARRRLCRVCAVVASAV